MILTAILPYILQLLHDAMGSEWGPLMALLSGWIVQLLSEDSSFPISLPSSWNTNVWKPVAIVLASEAQAVVVSIVQGHTDPVHTILLGLRTAMWSMGVWALVIKAIYNGKPPNWLNYLSLIFPVPTAAAPMNAVEREAVTLSEKDKFPPLPPPIVGVPRKPPPGAA